MGGEFDEVQTGSQARASCGLTSLGKPYVVWGIRKSGAQTTRCGLNLDAGIESRKYPGKEEDDSDKDLRT